MAVNHDRRSQVKAGGARRPKSANPGTSTKTKRPGRTRRRWEGREGARGREPPAAAFRSTSCSRGSRGDRCPMAYSDPGAQRIGPRPWLRGGLAPESSKSIILTDIITSSRPIPTPRNRHLRSERRPLTRPLMDTVLGDSPCICFFSLAYRSVALRRSVSLEHRRLVSNTQR